MGSVLLLALSTVVSVSSMETTLLQYSIETHITLPHDCRGLHFHPVPRRIQAANQCPVTCPGLASKRRLCDDGCVSSSIAAPCCTLSVSHARRTTDVTITPPLSEHALAMSKEELSVSPPCGRGHIKHGCSLTLPALLPLACPPVPCEVANHFAIWSQTVSEYFTQSPPLE